MFIEKLAKSRAICREFLLHAAGCARRPFDLDGRTFRRRLWMTRLIFDAT